MINLNNKLDHIGIAVSDLSLAKAFYIQLLDLEETHSEIVENKTLAVSFLEPKNKNSKNHSLELISPLAENSSVAKFIKSKGEGLHHLCYEVPNLELSIKHMVNSGARLLDGYPRLGSRGKMIAFFHPKSTLGCLIEICNYS